MKNRGLYGQAEGHESPTATASLNERIGDNEIVEGHELATLRRMLKEKKYQTVESFIEKLKNLGWSQQRRESLLSRAWYGVRI